MKQLSKADALAKANHVQKLVDAANAVSAAYEAINDRIANELNDAIQAYNDALAEAESFREDMTGEMEDYINDRTEKWADSEAGEAYRNWQGDWQGFDATELPPENALVAPDMGHAEEFDGLPNDAGE